MILSDEVVRCLSLVPSTRTPLTQRCTVRRSHTQRQEAHSNCRPRQLLASNCHSRVRCTLSFPTPTHRAALTPPFAAGQDLFRDRLAHRVARRPQAPHPSLARGAHAHRLHREQPEPGGERSRNRAGDGERLLCEAGQRVRGAQGRAHRGSRQAWLAVVSHLLL